MPQTLDTLIIGAGTAGLAALREVRKRTDNYLLVNDGPWGTTYAANLRLKAAEMDEAGWLKYTAELHTRPIMPDFNVRAMHEDDRRALYRFIKSLGPGGQKAPEYLPPGQTPPLPYLQMVLPPPPAAAPPAPPAG